MKRADALAARLAADIAARSRAIGAPVTIDPRAALDRGDALALAPPGIWSANRSCRLLRADDGWLAVNLARQEDIELIPAWLGRSIGADPWRAVATVLRSRSCQDVLEQARLLGLPVAVVGESAPRIPALSRLAAGGARKALNVVDLSTLWAGPLCASIFAAAGAEVVKIESSARPDTTWHSAPALDRRLNGRKRRVALNFRNDADRETLTAMVAGADVLVTSSRQRAFAPLGLTPEAVYAANPGLVWVAISGHGWDSDRIAFGDDASAAGGLVRWTRGGSPRFVGDALADPLTGLAAAAAAFEALALSGGIFVDAAMAPVAACAR